MTLRIREGRYPRMASMADGTAAGRRPCPRRRRIVRGPQSRPPTSVPAALDKPAGPCLTKFQGGKTAEVGLGELGLACKVHAGGTPAP